MKCKHCGSKLVIKSGICYYGKRKQRWLCKSCGRVFLTELKVTRPAQGDPAAAISRRVPKGRAVMKIRRGPSDEGA